jgi:hypothetical protein
MAYEGNYDAQADAMGYRNRLGAIANREASLAQYMGQQNIESSQMQLERERMRAESDMYGASVGQGAMGLRTARYGADDMNQRAATEAELMRQIEEQQLRQQMLDTYGRSAEYTLAGEQGAQQYGAIENAADADEYERQKNKEKQKLAVAAKATGIAAGTASNMVAASSERDLKTHIAQASPREQDEALRALSSRGPGPRDDYEMERERRGAVFRAYDEGTYGPQLEEARPRPVAPMQTIGVGQLGRRLDAGQMQMPSGAVDAPGGQGIPSYHYEYRPEVSGGPMTPEGPRFGPMADDLDRTAIGRTMLVDTPQGRAIDTGSAAIGSLSLASRANQRVEELARRLDAEEPPEWTRGRR